MPITPKTGSLFHADLHAGLIEIELKGGRRVRVDRDVDAAALERVLDVLARR